MTEKKAKKTQEETQRNYMKLNQLSQEIQKTEKELQNLEIKRQDLEKVKENIKEISKIKNKETLIPVENGIFVKGRIEETDRLIIGIGANILTEKTPEQTQQIINKKQKEIEETIKKTLQNLEKIHQQGQEIQKQMAGE